MQPSSTNPSGPPAPAAQARAPAHAARIRRFLARKDRGSQEKHPCTARLQPHRVAQSAETARSTMIATFWRMFTHNLEHMSFNPQANVVAQSGRAVYPMFRGISTRPLVIIGQPRLPISVSRHRTNVSDPFQSPAIHRNRPDRLDEWPLVPLEYRPLYGRLVGAASPRTRNAGLRRLEQMSLVTPGTPPRSSAGTGHTRRCEGAPAATIPLTESP